MVVGVTGTGCCPGLGSRLRTLAGRLIIAAGLAALGWLCAAALGTATATATGVVHAVVPAVVSPVVPAKPVVHHHAIAHPVVPKAIRVTASRHVPVVQHHATAVVRHVVTPVVQARPHVVPAVRRPDAPLRAPPSPVVPAGWIASAHGSGGVARSALVPEAV